MPDVVIKPIASAPFPADPRLWHASDEIKSAFIDTCRLAMTDDGVFTRLRQSPGVIAATDSVSVCHAISYWRIIKALGGDPVMSRMREVMYVDGYLSPAVQLTFDDWLLSPAIVRYLSRAILLNELCGGLRGKRIVEIGGGWGGLAAVVQLLFEVNSYAICDLLDVGRASGQFLSRINLPVRFPTGPAELDGDVLVSDYAFCEMLPEAREAYGSGSFNRFAFGSLTAPSFHADSLMFTPGQMRKDIKRWVPDANEVNWGTEEPLYKLLGETHALPSVEDAYVWRK